MFEISRRSAGLIGCRRVPQNDAFAAHIDDVLEKRFQMRCPFTLHFWCHCNILPLLFCYPFHWIYVLVEISIEFYWLTRGGGGKRVNYQVPNIVLHRFLCELACRIPCSEICSNRSDDHPFCVQFSWLLGSSVVQTL